MPRQDDKSICVCALSELLFRISNPHTTCHFERAVGNFA